uniref:Uncharacterized protein n=1 Tax=Arundo donax TaxID=35708 RepID=A0A0A9A952_ARUDO
MDCVLLFLLNIMTGSSPVGSRKKSHVNYLHGKLVPNSSSSGGYRGMVTVLLRKVILFS